MAIKIIQTRLTRQNQNTEWYAVSDEPKSENFLALQNLIQTKSLLVSPQVDPSGLTAGADVYIDEENLAEYLSLSEAVIPEQQAYNDANGITLSTTIIDQNQ